MKLGIGWGCFVLLILLVGCGNGTHSNRLNEASAVSIVDRSYQDIITSLAFITHHQRLDPETPLLNAIEIKGYRCLGGGSLDLEAAVSGIEGTKSATFDGTIHYHSCNWLGTSASITLDGVIVFSIGFQFSDNDSFLVSGNIRTSCPNTVDPMESGSLNAHFNGQFQSEWFPDAGLKGLKLSQETILDRFHCYGENAIFCEVFAEANFDADHDEVLDFCDNCPFVANPDQADTDSVGLGDACSQCSTPPTCDSQGDCDEFLNTCPMWDPLLEKGRQRLSCENGQCTPRQNIDVNRCLPRPVADCAYPRELFCDAPGTLTPLSGYDPTAPASDCDGDCIPNIEDSCPMDYQVVGVNSGPLGSVDLDRDGLANPCDMDADGDGIEFLDCKNEQGQTTACIDICPTEKASFAVDRANAKNRGLLDEDGNGQDDRCAFDPDADGKNIKDNCPILFNIDQADQDTDGSGDTCDCDDDNDGTEDDLDLCPLTAGANQNDADGDHIGDICDPCPAVPYQSATDTDQDSVPDDCDDDDDNDGSPDASDSCSLDPLYYPDSDQDGFGDGCDICPDNALIGQDNAVDLDGDGVLDEADNCLCLANVNQENRDGDLFGDACDSCIDTFNNGQLLTKAKEDPDSDGLGQQCDNCPEDFNPDQADSDNNGRGDACQASCFPSPTCDEVAATGRQCGSIPGEQCVEGCCDYDCAGQGFMTVEQVENELGRACGDEPGEVGYMDCCVKSAPTPGCFQQVSNLETPLAFFSCEKLEELTGNANYCSDFLGLACQDCTKLRDLYPESFSCETPTCCTDQFIPEP